MKHLHKKARVANTQSIKIQNGKVPPVITYTIGLQVTSKTSFCFNSFEHSFLKLLNQLNHLQKIQNAAICIVARTISKAGENMTRLSLQTDQVQNRLSQVVKYQCVHGRVSQYLQECVLDTTVSAGFVL